MRHAINGTIVALLMVLGIYVLISAYNNVKVQAVEQLDAQQMILARAAAKGIETYFSTKEDLLETLGSMESVVKCDERGKRVLDDFYNAQKNEYYAVTRTDKSGRIIYSYPDIERIGTDISGQKHVRLMLHTHKPVLSNIFRSVQGLQSIALHVPVFDEGSFAGSVAVLLPFDRIARDFVSGIKIGHSGYAFLLSEDGIELYCPVPGHVGVSIFENCEGYTSILDMAREMLQGKEGITTYEFGMIRNLLVDTVTKHAVYLPVHLAQTFWSICIATPEDEILSVIEGFKIRWALALSLLLLAFGCCAFWIVRAYFAVQRKTEELALAVHDLNEANARLQKADKVKSIFIESVSHELRTPMTSIVGFTKLVGKDVFKNILPMLASDTNAKNKAERVVGNLKIIEFEAERLTRLINDVLDSAKIESGKMKWDDQVFMLHDILRLAVQTIQGQLVPGVAVVLPDDLSSPWVKADPDRMMQVMMNLLSNAAKFTKEGAISVGLKYLSDNVLEVSVTDTGMGIPSDECENIFERFYQVRCDNTGEAKPKGTGLGLSICKQIVEHYGGRIWVESSLGQGSAFKFTLPVARVAA